MEFLTVVIRLVAATVLGGIIGLERERKNRPAGFRTHILVCLGSALVMMISEMLFTQYEGRTSFDPTRIGAQVISGIGFLGAGTIIRQGVSVKGLTTAATLWATSCVGLAVGAGFYEGAIMGGAIIFLVLFLLGYLEKTYGSKSHSFTASLQYDDYFITIEEITKRLNAQSVEVKNIEFLKDGAVDENVLAIRCAVRLPGILKMADVASTVLKIDGVMDVDY